MTSLRVLTIAVAAVTFGVSEDRILIYTRNFVTNGKGYVHDNIATSVETIKALGMENGFAADASDDPKVFTIQNLKQYKAIVFSNSNHEAFENDGQREAFKKFVQSGGGVVGIHIATGTERQWPYFWSVMGGRFVRHPKIQKFTVVVKDPRHPATADLPSKFEWADECYLFDKMNPDVKVLLTADPAQLDDPKKAELPGGELRDGMYPLSWYNTFDGGRQYYTSLGHKKEHYAEPLLRKQITGGILWAMGKTR
ncbi:MAG TPA: ThuA domain-containing protein [Bryobacteraceae bacterium]|nr:ThuA domain-containing protein [Bryobacteraceae bacterium]